MVINSLLTLIDKYVLSLHQEAEMVGPEETSVEICGFKSVFLVSAVSCPQEWLMPLVFM